MKIKDIIVGHIYAAKILGKIVPVKIKAQYHKAWVGRDLTTGKEMYIISAAKLRYEMLISGRKERYTKNDI